MDNFISAKVDICVVNLTIYTETVVTMCVL